MVRLFSEKLEDGLTTLRRAQLGRATEEERFLALILFLQFERLCCFWFTRGVPIDRELAVTTLTRLWADALLPKENGAEAPKVPGRRRREVKGEVFAPRRST